ncbi:MAG: hypothetical protein RIC35_16435 [Marinoscillum sp.]
MILPKVDATTRAGINPASDGLLAYDPDEKAFYYYDSSALDYLHNPVCRIAAQFYEIAFIMRVE